MMEELQRESLSDAIAECPLSYATDVQFWQEWWTPLRVGQQLNALQIMVSAAFITERSRGKGNVTIHPKDMILTVRDPDMGFAVIHSESHWILLCSAGGTARYYDGEKSLDGSVLEKLACQGQKKLEAVGIPPALPEAIPGHWQYDRWSCGWFVLHGMRCLSDGLICMPGGQLGQHHMPPLDAPTMAVEINTWADKGMPSTCIVIDDDEESHDKAQLKHHSSDNIHAETTDADPIALTSQTPQMQPKQATEVNPDASEAMPTMPRCENEMSLVRTSQSQETAIVIEIWVAPGWGSGSKPCRNHVETLSKPCRNHVETHQQLHIISDNII